MVRKFRLDHAHDTPRRQRRQRRARPPRERRLRRARVRACRKQPRVLQHLLVTGSRGALRPSRAVCGFPGAAAGGWRRQRRARVQRRSGGAGLRAQRGAARDPVWGPAARDRASPSGCKVERRVRDSLIARGLGAGPSRGGSEDGAAVKLCPKAQEYLAECWKWWNDLRMMASGSTAEERIELRIRL
jgi:hypothetical protein